MTRLASLMGIIILASVPGARGVAQPAPAHPPGPATDVPTGQVKSIVDIVAQLEAAGYQPVLEISQEGGAWEVEAYRGNTPLELLVDAKTGRVLTEYPDDPQRLPPQGSLPLSQVLRRLVESGHENIIEASFDSGRWEVEYFRQGLKRELRIDPKSGAILSDRVDD